MRCCRSSNPGASNRMNDSRSLMRNSARSSDRLSKLRQKDRDARWTVKLSKAKSREDGLMRRLMLRSRCSTIHVSIDRGFGNRRRTDDFKRGLI